MAKISLPCLAAFVVSVLRVVPESCFARSISGDSKAGAFYYLVNFGYIEVWSLTQFYSVDFSKSRSGVKNAFSTNTQSRFASAVLDGVLGPSCLARHN